MGLTGTGSDLGAAIKIAVDSLSDQSFIPTNKNPVFEVIAPDKILNPVAVVTYSISGICINIFSISLVTSLDLWIEAALGNCTLTIK